MKIIRVSPITGKTNTMDLPISNIDWLRYTKGTELIQNIFPNLTLTQREFIISGCTEEDWETMTNEAEEPEVEKI